MRTIKFKAFDKEKKHIGEVVQIVYPCKDAYGNMCSGGVRIKDVGGETYWIDDGKFVLMQFTGLTDKNGMELYEGDIVHNWRKPWKDVPYVYRTIAITWDKTDTKNGWNIVPQQSLEIIGSVHTNPELLNA